MLKLLRALVDIFTHHIKLKTKLLLSHLILVLLPTIAVGLLYYKTSYQPIISDTIRSEQALSEQTVTTLETVFNQVETASSTVITNNFFKTIVADQAAALQLLAAAPEQVEALVDSALSQQGDIISQVKIYVHENLNPFYEHQLTSEMFLPLTQAKGSHWYGIMSGSNLSELFCPTFYLSPLEADSYGEFAYIQKITHGGNEESAAYCVIYFSEEIMNDILKQQTTTSGVSYLLNERNILTATSDSSLAGTCRLEYDELKQSPGKPNKYITTTILDEKFYIGYYEITTTDWILVSALPAAPIIWRGNQIVISFLAIYIIVVFLAFLFASRLSGSITNRIAFVIRQMRMVKSDSGRPKSLNIPTSQDEIGDLIDTYNFMTNEIRDLLIQQERNAFELQTSEFKALQAQINPHFLYNSLDMISWLAKNGDCTKVSEAVVALSKFYKLTLSKKDVDHTVAIELQHVSLYIQLQNMRYDDKIHFYVDIPDELLECSIPKLTFQPIVENSIQHGIFEKETQEGDIVITGWIESNDVVILISDNGVGISAEAMDTVLTGAWHQGDSSNIGIYNTHNRLQLLFGMTYGLSYQRNMNGGTEVFIRLPK
jgi:two-component system sensor histidine kinase YesM